MIFCEMKCKRPIVKRFKTQSIFADAILTSNDRPYTLQNKTARKSTCSKKLTSMQQSAIDRPIDTASRMPQKSKADPWTEKNTIQYGNIHSVSKNYALTILKYSSVQTK